MKYYRIIKRYFLIWFILPVSENNVNIFLFFIRGKKTDVIFFLICSNSFFNGIVEGINLRIYLKSFRYFDLKLFLKMSRRKNNPLRTRNHDSFLVK